MVVDGEVVQDPVWVWAEVCEVVRDPVWVWVWVEVCEAAAGADGRAVWNKTRRQPGINGSAILAPRAWTCRRLLCCPKVLFPAEAFVGL